MFEDYRVPADEIHKQKGGDRDMRIKTSLRRTCFVPALMLGIMAVSAVRTVADEKAEVIVYHNYSKAIRLSRGMATAVLSPQAGGRVLEFNVGGRNAMWFDDAEKHWQPGASNASSAGRFDYGPELTVTPHPQTWGGDWTGEITGNCSARLTGPAELEAGIQVIRDVHLVEEVNGTIRLSCQQTLKNIGTTTREVCHWGRSFSPGGGICLIPLGDRPSRFPSKYAMYEEGSIINVRNSDPNIRERDGFIEILAPPRKPKLGFDSYAGWFGYLMPDGTLFVKKFATYPDRVYNEAAGLTISVWYPPGDRIELEPIGPRERLAPGQSASFTEDWYLLTFPFPKPEGKVDLKQLNEHVGQAIGVK